MTEEQLLERWLNRVTTFSLAKELGVSPQAIRTKISRARKARGINRQCAERTDKTQTTTQ